MLEEFKQWAESEQGEKAINDHVAKLIKLEKITNNQLERFHSKLKNNIINFDNVINKVILKYSSIEYQNKWYDKGIQPPETLFFFLFDYAEKYGRKCDDMEWKIYGNMFTAELLFCNGYYFNKMNGQGTVVQIIVK